jgi:hypothetical protein
MRSIGGEPPLNGKSLFQPVERVIDGGDERERLGRYIGLGQPQRDRSWPDGTRPGRCRSQRQQAPANAVRGEQQGERHERRHIPGDIEDEFPQNRVDQLIAARRFSDQHR